MLILLFSDLLWQQTPDYQQRDQGYTICLLQPICQTQLPWQQVSERFLCWWEQSLTSPASLAPGPWSLSFLPVGFNHRAAQSMINSTICFTLCVCSWCWGISGISKALWSQPEFPIDLICLSAWPLHKGQTKDPLTEDPASDWLVMNV